MIPIFVALLAASLIPDVRKAATGGDLQGGEKLVREYQKQEGVTPESLEAYSWLGRGALAQKKYEEAARYAAETRKLVLARVNAKTLDNEKHLPIALGAAIEVHGQVLNAKEGRSSAVEYLQGELGKFRSTSIRTRIQKNINLLGLEGKPAPKLQGYRLSARPTLLFFWAHWCPDCKAMASVLTDAQKAYPKLAIVGPTRLYGYAAAGEDAPPAQEKVYIAGVQKQFYAGVAEMAAPVSEENFMMYGASTTPTIVLVDASGMVRLYHPGRMTLDELRPHLDKIAR